MFRGWNMRSEGIMSQLTKWLFGALAAVSMSVAIQVVFAYPLQVIALGVVLLVIKAVS